jgi:hypothetical protein
MAVFVLSNVRRMRVCRGCETDHWAPQFLSCDVSLTCSPTICRAGPVPSARMLSQTGDAIHNLRRELINRPIPSACSYDLLGWIMTIYNDGPSGSTGDDSPNFHIIQDLGIRWIVMPRTIDEIVCVLSARCGCTHEQTSTRIHELGVATCSQSAYEHPTHTLVNFFACALSRIKKSPELRPFDFGIRKDWPTTVEHILPYGAEHTLRGALSWLMAPISPRLTGGFLVLIEWIVAICAPAVLPLTVASTSLLDLVLVKIKFSVNTLSAHQSSRRWTPMLMDACHLLQHSILLLNAIFSFINEEQMRRFLGARAQELLAVAAEAETAVCSTIQKVERRALSQLPGLDLNTLRGIDRAISDMGGAIYDAYPPACSQVKRMASDWSDHSKTFGKSEHGVLWLRFLQFFVRFRYLTQCRNPGCKYIFWNSKNILVCGGCRRTLYCSRRCQKHAWSRLDAPHREICSALRFLCVRYNLSIRQVRVESKEIPADPAFVGAARVMVDHFIALTTATMSMGRT